MDLLKRALSLPLIFKDWDDPLSGFKHRKSRWIYSQKEKNKKDVFNDTGSRLKQKKKSKLLQTWNRLIESRSTSRIPTLVETKEEYEEQNENTRLSSQCISSRVTLHTDYSSSSCDLAPTLLSIYDNYATNSKLSTKNGIIKNNHHNQSKDLPVSSSSSPRNLSRSCHNVHWCTGNKSCKSPQKSQSVEILNERMDEDIHMKDVSGSRNLDEPAVNISVSVTPSSSDDLNNRITLVTTTQDISGLSATAALNTVSVHTQLSENDAKKRPLSVSSTSSSVSSSSSLPRHQRKKIATMAVSNITTSLTGDQYCDLCKQHGDCPHKIIRTDVLHSGQCSCAQSSKEGQLRHVCRVHGPAVDISIAKSLCPNCNHSRIGFGEHNHICDISEVSESNSEVNESDNLSNTANSLQDLNRSLSDPGGSGHNRSPSNVSHSQWFFGSYLGKVVHEILETERIYVNDLRDIVQGYVGYLDSSHDLAFDNEEKRDLFGNINEIYNFNREFLEYLEKCELDPVQVAQCFVDRSEGFIIYTDYCTNYPRSMEVLTKVMRDKDLSEIFKHQQMHLHHALPLGSYLLKPVQRILKYHLFLENMLNNFEKCKTGYDVISQALQSMTDLAQHINEMKRQHECAVHIQEIQSTLFGWDDDDLTTYGTLVLEDTFRMHGAKAYRHMYLFEKGLIIAKRKEDGNLLVKDTIKCSDLMLRESIPKEPLSFQVVPFSNPKVQYTLQAKNLDHKHKWCQQIKRMMIENYQAVIPDKAKELMMKLGKSKEEEDFDEKGLEDQGLAKKQHTAPEYLQKRRHRRKSTSIIPDFGLLKNRRGRRQSEETSSPSSLLHNKSEPTGFVSYLSHRLGIEDVLEEADDIEELSESQSSTRGSSKSSTLDSQVPSFDGFTDDIESDRHNPKALSFVDIDIENTCMGAKRISRIASDDAILQEDDTNIQLYENQNTCTEIPPSLVQSESSDKQTNCPHKTYDSTEIVQNTSQKSIADDSKHASKLPLGVTKTINVEDLDDGYVGVVFSNHSMTVPVIGESSTDEKDYIILPVQGESSTDPDIQKTNNQDCELLSKSGTKIFTNKYVNINDKLNVVKTKGAISKSCNKKNLVNTSGAIVLQNSLTITDYSNITENIPKNEQYRLFSDSPVPGDSFHSKYNKTSTPVSCAQMTRTSETSPMCTSKTTVLGSVYSVNNLGSPVRITSDLKNGLSQSKLDCSLNNMDTTDPWVPRNDAKTPCSRYRARKSVFRQYSMNAVDAAKKISAQKRISKLFRSNSCTSLDEGKNNSNKKQTSHKRMYSDTSTLVFSNKTAFLSSECPRTLKYNPEIQRTLTRYATPPREMGPDYLIDEINECKEKGKIATRYATPPRELMDPSLLSNGTIYKNNYTCALENEILENLRKEMQQNAILDEQGTSVTSSNFHIPHQIKGHSGSKHQTCIAKENSENRYDNNSQMWKELQAYLARTPNSTSGHKLNLLFQSSVTASSRPESFHSAVSNSVINSKRPVGHIDTELKCPVAASSTSVFNNDRLVDSLKNAVINLTSKITRRSPRSVDASPVRITTRRARSLGAEEDARIKNFPSSIVQKTECKSQKFSALISKDKKRDKRRNRFGFNFARTYSDKLKKNKLDDNKEESNLLGKQALVLSQDMISKSDMTAVAERMADARPKVLGTYTLRKQTIVKPEKTENSEADSLELMDTQDEFSDKSKLNTNHTMLPSDAMCVNLDNSGSDINEDSPSLEYFYEKQCNDVLECQLGNETYRDSAVYSDDGGLNSLDSDFSSPNVVVEETKVKLEKKNSHKDVKKMEVRGAEKGQGIQNILKSLEAASTNKPVKNPIDPSGHPVKSVSNSVVAADDLRKVKMSPSLQRNRCRELMEVAMLTRIRQNSFDGLEDDNDSSGIMCACECNGSCDGNELDDKEEECKPRKGKKKTE